LADPSETTRVSESPADLETRELLDAVRSLAAQVGSLQADVQALRGAAGALPLAESEPHGWDERAVGTQQSPPWVRSLDTPPSRRPAVPRLALELLFLVAVAIVVALARLDAIAIVVIMGAAWGLVAVAEWAAAREAAKRDTALLRSGLASTAAREDASWFGPPVGGASALRPTTEDTAARLPPPLHE
jgi:hypothetical protein